MHQYGTLEEERANAEAAGARIEAVDQMMKADKLREGVWDYERELVNQSFDGVTSLSLTEVVQRLRAIRGEG